MINEIIEKEEQKTLQELYEYQEIEKELQGLMQIRLKLEKEVMQDEANLRMPIPVARQTFNIFQKMFSKTYKQYLEKKEKYEIEAEKAQERIAQTKAKRQELEKLKREIFEKERAFSAINVEELRQKALDFKDEKRAVEVILEENPKLTENVEIMKEVIGMHQSFIKYDSTDNLQLYILILEKTKENKQMKEKYERLYPGRKFEEVIDRAKDELQNPKKVQEGKYKIPTKYLYEAIRNDLGEDNYTMGNVDEYLNKDGKLSKETGEKIQQLYESNENYLLLHDMFNGHDNSNKDAEEEIAKNICLEGLRCTGQNKHNQLNATTLGNYEQNISFLTYLGTRMYYRIFLSIPKEIIDGNKALIGAETSQVGNNEKFRYSLYFATICGWIFKKYGL